MALAAMKSAKTEAYCIEAWNKECYGEMQEYQRIAVLHALFLMQSARLPDYLDLAKKDGRKWLVQNALDIASRMEPSE